MKKIIVIYSLFLIMLTNADSSKTILVFGGKSGYLGQILAQGFSEKGHRVVCAQSRIENRQDIIDEINSIKPDAIINATGLTGKSNIDWCDAHKQDTIRVNLMGTINLIDVAYLHNLHVTNISTGCFYKYDEKHPIGSGIGFTEEDEPNFDKTYYSKTKIYLEKFLLEYPNVLNLRVTMPVTSENHPRNFIIKLTQYKKIMNVPISLTVLDDLLPVAIDMTLKGHKGNFNFVNPGVITHNEILDLYKEHVNPQFKYESFSALEQIKILQTGRSNCELDTKKLLALYPHVPPLKESIKSILQKMSMK